MGDGQWAMASGGRASVMFCHGPLTERRATWDWEGELKLGSNYLNGGEEGKRESHRAKDVDILRWTSNPK
jgi:hypothetical protein